MLLCDESVSKWDSKRHSLFKMIIIAATLILYHEEYVQCDQSGYALPGSHFSCFNRRIKVTTITKLCDGLVNFPFKKAIFVYFEF